MTETPTPSSSTPALTPASQLADTPLMRQYWDLKQKAGDALLLFRMGDFYELFGPDAVVAAELLEITLTSRDKNKPNPLPMAGVPFHSASGYINRLLKAGKKVAIAEQLDGVEPETAKGAGKPIVKREIVRVFSPGVQFDLEDTDANYLAVVWPMHGATARSGLGNFGPNGGGRSNSARPISEQWILACLDAATGETLISQPLGDADIELELDRLGVRQVLRMDTAEGSSRSSQGSKAKTDSTVPSIDNADPLTARLVELLPPNWITAEKAKELLQVQYQLGDLRAFFPVGIDLTLVGLDTPEWIASRQILALSVAVQYVLKSQQKDRLHHLKLPSPLHAPRSLVFGPKVAEHLDLLPTVTGNPSLFSCLPKPQTAAGTRLLKRWLINPLAHLQEIEDRQFAVRELSSATLASNREEIRASLKEVYDFERLLGRLSAGLASPRDVYAIGRSIIAAFPIFNALASMRGRLLEDLRANLDHLKPTILPLGQKIIFSLLDDAPTHTRDGGIFKRGIDPGLDRLLSLTDDGQRWLIALEAKEREKTGIPSLKVRFNRVFGYYIEVTQAHLKNVPPHYHRKQTTVGGERFVTDELKKFEEELLTASDRQKALEIELFEQLTAQVRNLVRPLSSLAQSLATLDGLTSLALLADRLGWEFPTLDNSRSLELVDCRHPLLEKLPTFVPNTVRLGPECHLTLLITGPNMGGKSTVMRQTALCVILGQIGAPIPASSGKWGVVSSLFTRIGAQDAISRGQSTFMVEMTELAHLLHHADDRSLILLDEIGRGTSTYDGISVAWATLEWICRQIRSRTLFATHYHELTRLAGKVPSLANFHMAAESGRRGSSTTSPESKIRFLFELRPGPASESFGIHVAYLAGLPKPVVERAWQVLAQLEDQGSHSLRAGENGAGTSANLSQLSLFELQNAESSVVGNPGDDPGDLAAWAVEKTQFGVSPSSTEEHGSAPAEQRSVVLPQQLAALSELAAADPDSMTPLQALNLVIKLRDLSQAGGVTG